MPIYNTDTKTAKMNQYLLIPVRLHTSSYDVKREFELRTVLHNTAWLKLFP